MGVSASIIYVNELKQTHNLKQLPDHQVLVIVVCWKLRLCWEFGLSCWEFGLSFCRGQEALE